MNIPTPASVQTLAYRELRRRLERATRYLAGEVKRTLSVPAARRIAKRGGTGDKYYRATTPATRGAPPRKLSGRLRASITQTVVGDGSDPRTLQGIVGTNVRYARRHEYGVHPFLVPTARAALPALDRIMSQP